MSLLLLFGKSDGGEPPVEPPSTPSGGSRTSPWLSFKDQTPRQSRRQRDDDEALLLLSL